MKLKIFVLLGFIFILCNQSYSQENNSRVYVILGLNSIPIENLNTQLRGNGYNELGSSHITLGFGGNANLGRFLIGGEGYYLRSSPKESNNVQISMVGSLGYFYGGYQVLSKEKFYLAPIVGFGGGGVQVDIDSNVNTSLANYLSNNYSKKLGTGNFIVHTGLRGGFDISKNFEIDLGIGYNIGFNGSNWDTVNGSLSDSVSDKIGGFYSMITFAILIPE